MRKLPVVLKRNVVTTRSDTGHERDLNVGRFRTQSKHQHRQIFQIVAIFTKLCYIVISVVYWDIYNANAQSRLRNLSFFPAEVVVVHSHKDEIAITIFQLKDNSNDAS